MKIKSFKEKKYNYVIVKAIKRFNMFSTKRELFSLGINKLNFCYLEWQLNLTLKVTNDLTTFWTNEISPAVKNKMLTMSTLIDSFTWDHFYVCEHAVYERTVNYVHWEHCQMTYSW